LEASAHELACILRERQAVMAQLAQLDEAIQETERLDAQREAAEHEASESGSGSDDCSEYRDKAGGEDAAESDDEEVVDQLVE
jgi:hypothetical protein